MEPKLPMVGCKNPMENREEWELERQKEISEAYNFLRENYLPDLTIEQMENDIKLVDKVIWDFYFLKRLNYKKNDDFKSALCVLDDCRDIDRTYNFPSKKITKAEFETLNKAYWKCRLLGNADEVRKEAINLCEKLIEEGFEAGYFGDALTMAYYKTKQYQKAIDFIKYYGEPKINDDINALLGHCYYHLKDYQNALKYFCYASIFLDEGIHTHYEQIIDCFNKLGNKKDKNKFIRKYRRKINPELKYTNIVYYNPHPKSIAARYNLITDFKITYKDSLERMMDNGYHIDRVEIDRISKKEFDELMEERKNRKEEDRVMYKISAIF